MVIAYRSVPVESTDGQFEEKQQYDMAPGAQGINSPMSIPF